VSRPRVCLYIVGAPPPDVESEFGTYIPWFKSLTAEADLYPWDGTTGDIPPNLDSFDGFIVTGSPSSLVEPEPWMQGGLDITTYAMEDDKPLLGVCFGHQLIGKALGYPVIENPKGWEIGTYEIKICEEEISDPLFSNLETSFAVNLSHRDVVHLENETIAPNGMKVGILARSPKTQAQIIAVKENIRGVQFHPEFNGAITRAYIQCRSDKINADAIKREVISDKCEYLLKKTVDAPASVQIFQNFIQNFILTPH